ncbi:MAG: hypothetical protein ABL857_04090 [Rickettsiales bacterium]|jgi:hypothetical protein
MLARKNHQPPSIDEIIRGINPVKALDPINVVSSEPLKPTPISVALLTSDRISPTK